MYENGVKFMLKDREKNIKIQLASDRKHFETLRNGALYGTTLEHNLRRNSRTRFISIYLYIQRFGSSIHQPVHNDARNTRTNFQ